MYLDGKETSVKNQLPNIFKNHHIVAQSKPTTVGYDEWCLSLAHEYFHIYRCQLSFAMFAVTSPLGISWQHLNHPNLLVRCVYRFHVYVHVRLILHELGIFLPQEGGFSKVRNDYIKNAYYNICDDYDVDANETWMHFTQQIMLFLVMR